ncbi:phage major capsid protein, P2 family [Hahella sp. HN01]|uniref:phage major capsid protein, P2 family n=1 Tax=Hahella sp. HN01 TaxID=2847262 RepID=UPI001C1EB072|nr:phage major capsid protein, P2 family [Hahella sp. HN01]MBU6951006.1 phage major capsid protein, P2 family [Hahella sp. HN01]
MNFKTKKLFNDMCAAMAATYGVGSVAEQFNVEPTIAQELQDKITESSEFLQLINVVAVDELKGEKVIGSVTGFVPKRTDTDSADRQTSDVLALGSKGYELHPVEYDTHIKYKTIDSWAKFPDFQARYGGWVRKAISLSKLRVGWLGTSCALPATKPGDHPNGEDVNKGWLQQLREFKSGSQWFVEGATAGQIRIGEGGDFANLDAAVHACLQMVDELHRDGGDLVVIMGRDLLAEDKAQLYAAQGHKPTEKERLENQAIIRTYGGLPAITAPFFPARGLLVTSLDNLSLYYQADSLRRQVIDNPKRNRVEDFNSLNEGYVIEDETKAAGFEFANVKLPDGSGAWA